MLREHDNVNRLTSLLSNLVCIIIRLMLCIENLLYVIFDTS